MREITYKDLNPKWVVKTKQQFTHKDDMIYLNQEYFCDFTVCNVLDIMNNLIAENERLKIDKQNCYFKIGRIRNRCRQFKYRVFEVINGNIAENQGYNDEYCRLKVQVLEDLKEELMSDD